MSEQSLFGGPVYFNLAYTSNVFIIVGAKQGYSKTSGSIPWQINMYVDDTFVNFAGGATAYTDSPSCFAALTSMGQGQHKVLVTWNADTSLKLTGINLSIQGSYK